MNITIDPFHLSCRTSVVIVQLCVCAFVGTSDVCAQSLTNAPKGFVVFDNKVQAQVSSVPLMASPLRMEAIFVGSEETAEHILSRQGIIPDALAIESFKKLNSAAFNGNKAKSNAVLFVPKLQLYPESERKRYSLKFSDSTLGRVQLQSNALTLSQLSDRFKALPATTLQEKENVSRGTSILVNVSKNIATLGESYATNLNGSELATISLQAEMTAHIARQTNTTNRAPDAITLKLMEESGLFLTNFLQSTASVSTAILQTGRKVTIDYTLEKKHIEGLRLYAVPLGMKYNPTRYKPELIERAIAIGAFDHLTSPSSKHLPWGNYAIVAGPPNVTKAFVTKFVGNQEKLDIMTVSVSTTNSHDIEITIPARNPNQ